MAEFDFGTANDAQREAILTTEGPLLITAGPGTGKTFTLVKRVAYLIAEKGVEPSSILVATFTEKAAKELVTRIANELTVLGIDFDASEMYIGTFHSICLRVIKENIEYSTLKKNYRVADSFDQRYLIFRKYYAFKDLPHWDFFPQAGGVWGTAERICSIANILAEELIDVEKFDDLETNEAKAYAEASMLYRDILAENNWLDFSTIQTETYRMLQESPCVLGALRGRIRYVMVDEYQDTNYIQEQLTLLLGGEAENICVVGDDDQGLYRFRGATIRNILEFPKRFSRSCKRIDLDVNYRSDPNIVAFYNEWMERTAGPRFRFEWDGYRFEKTIRAALPGVQGAPAVAKINAEDEGWCDAVCDFVEELYNGGHIVDYNQVAFLFKSVKHRNALDLARRFEERGINVYSPRSNSFFDRDEIKLLVGLLLLTFPQYVRRIEMEDFKFVDDGELRYYASCVVAANAALSDPDAKPLKRWVVEHGRAHLSMNEGADYAFTGLVYQMFEFEPFKTILDTPLDTGVHDQRAVRNLSTFVGITARFEYLNRIAIFTPEYLDRDLEHFFHTFLRFMMRGGIDEYEDETEYVPSGCVPFLTIHQSKGMEFPIVVVDSLYATPTKNVDDTLEALREKYGKRPAYEPLEAVKYFDFWRLYYTAFSRAQDLLVLTHREGGRKIGKAFERPYGELPALNPRSFPFEKFYFHRVKESDLKPSYAFTSDISIYEGCPVQYKLFRELDFTPVAVGATMFGHLVHQTIEDVHRAALRGEADSITPENAEVWFDMNYETLSKSEHSYLSPNALAAAKRQVLRYVERRAGRWGDIVEAEVSVGLAKDDYIIHGTIDLVQGEDGSVDLVDFKSEKKPDVNRDFELLETYRKQLLLYAYLVEEKTGHKVNRLRLYYTGEENGNPEIVFRRDDESIDAVASEFDEVAHKIMKKDYSCRARDGKLCSNCDFRFYCRN